MTKKRGIIKLSILSLRKGKALMEKLRAKSMYEEDEDFPGDDDETYLSLDVRIQSLPSTTELECLGVPIDLEKEHHLK